MARYTNIQTNFSGGLITDNLVGRTDLQRTANSCRTLTNFFPSLQGPASYRQGFELAHASSTDTATNVKQVQLTLATKQSYRVVFGANTIRIYDTEGTLKATIDSPYSDSQLKDLRFSSETDVLYVCHPNHRPKKLTADVTFVVSNLNAADGTDSDSDPDPLYDAGPDGDKTTTGDNRRLRTTIETQGDTSWTLADITTEIEPFLEPDTSGTRLKVVKGEEVVKIESSAADFSAIYTDYSDNSNIFTQDWYVEYEVNGIKLLGKVIDESTNYTEVTGPSSNGKVVYVDAVDFITVIKDSSAKLYLLDNAETSDTDDDILAKDGVPEGEIHLRSDTAVFDNAQVGSYIRVGSDQQLDDVVIGHTRNTTRWVKVEQFLGSESHPVDFLRGTATTTAADSEFYEYSSIYKSYGPGTFNVRDSSQTTTAKVVDGGQRTFTWSGGDFDSGSVSGTDASSVVGNLTTSKTFQVHKIDTSVGSVETYDSSGGNLIEPAGTLTVTEIANDVQVTADTSNFFEASTSVGRYIKGDMPSGIVYMKILAYESGTQVRARLKTPIPRDERTGSFENSGFFVSFNMGAWYTDNFPSAVAKFERRRVYGGTPTHPNFIFLSELDDDTDFSPAEADKTVLDTNGISYPLGNVNSSVRWLVSGRDLVVGTTRGIFRLNSNQFAAAISPKTIRFELVDEVNCGGEPHMIGTSIFFPDESDTKLMEYKYDANIQRDNANDVSKFIFPIFVQNQIKKVAVQETPQPRIWVLTNNGDIYCLTYQRQEDYYAWSKIALTSAPTDITVIREGYDSGVDQVVVAVDRFGFVQYEVLSSDANINDYPTSITESSDAEPTLYLDSAETGVEHEFSSNYNTSTRELTITPTNTSVFANGRSVDVVVGGVYMGSFTVTGGTLTVPTEISGVPVRWTIGFKYIGDLQPMYPTWDGANKPSFGTDEIRVVSCRTYLIDSPRYRIGVDGNYETIEMTGFISSTDRQNPTSYSQLQSRFTGFDKERPVTGSLFGVDKTIDIRQDEPYPLTIAALVTKTDLAG